MKKIIFLSLLLFFLIVGKSNASTLFSESMIGNPGEIWTPSSFSLVETTTAATYVKDGIECINGSYCQYNAPITAQDNIIEFDIFSDGLPENLLFSCRDANNYNDEFRVFLHDDGTTHLERFYLGGGIGVENLPNYDYSNGMHHMKMVCNGENFSFIEDNKILANSTFLSPTYGSFNYIRFDMWRGNWIFSNYKFCDSLGCDEDVTPTPTLTPTPTPTPVEINLNVPLIKQTDDPWQSQEYDTAHIWSSISTTIHDWGCALTSAVMALQYNGITKMPDNTPLDPSSLNTWLKSQPDGYIGNGLVNWLAIPRLTRLAKLSFNNPSFTSDALEYKRIHGNSNDSITSDLKNGLPDILEEPGHFIVAKGTQGSTFTINDPYYNTSFLSDTYNNTYLAGGKYVPSNTDLSYIMFTGPDTLSLNVQTATGSSIGEEFLQQPLENDVNPSQKSGSPIKVFYYQQPLNDTYQLTISGNPQQYKVNGYLYDSQGDVKSFTLQGIIDATHSDSYDLNFDKENQLNEHITKEVTISSILFELNTLFKQKSIQKGLYNALHSILVNAQKAQTAHRIWEEKILLHVSFIILQSGKNWGINQEAYQLLSGDISQLKSSF